MAKIVRTAAAKPTADTTDAADYIDAILVQSLSRQAFRNGMDGCFFVTAMGRLSAYEQEILAGQIEPVLNQAFANSESASITRAMNALWSVEPSSSGAQYLKRLLEFRYLSGFERRRLTEAADKVQYAWEPARLQTDRDAWHRDAVGHLKEAADLLGDLALLKGVKARLDEIAEDNSELQHPQTLVELRASADRPEVHHFAQYHRSNEVLSDSPAQLAAMVAYQFAILGGLERMSAVDVIQEGNHVPWIPQIPELEQEQQQIRKDVAFAFRGGLPKSVGELDSRQVAYLLIHGAGRIYQCLHPSRVSLWEDLSVMEGKYLLYEIDAQTLKARTALGSAAKGSSEEFRRALEIFKVRTWEENQFTMLYREQRLAEISGRILKENPQARLAIIYGAGHDLKNSFERVSRRIGPFTLTRYDWDSQAWARKLPGLPLEPFPTPERQREFAHQVDGLGPEGLSVFTDEEALAVGVRKLRSNEVYTLDQQASIASTYYRVVHPELEQLSKRLDRLLADAIQDHSTDKCCAPAH